MSYIGKEDIANIVPRVLSLIRDSPKVSVFGRYLELYCGIQDINYLEEKGFIFVYDKQFTFGSPVKEFNFEFSNQSFVMFIDLNYWLDLFLRFQSANYKTFLPKDYRERVKRSYELRTPIHNSQPKI